MNAGAESHWVARGRRLLNAIASRRRSTSRNLGNRTGRDAISLEPLENRTLFAFIGGESRLNLSTTNNQTDPAVAMNANGESVAVWVQGRTDAEHDIYMRRFDASGNSLFPEQRINTVTSGHQSSPAVAMNLKGQFIVLWHGHSGVGDDTNIYGQRFESDGNPYGPEFLVNRTTAGYQMWPAVTLDRSGRIIAAWASDSQDGSGWGVVGNMIEWQPWDDGFRTQWGSRRADTILSQIREGHQVVQDIAVDQDGDTVVTWSSNSAQDDDGGGQGVYYRTFTRNILGNPDFDEPVHGDRRANVYQNDNQSWASIGMSGDGQFAIAWASDTAQDGAGYGVFARRFDASGNAKDGADIPVNTTTAGNQAYPDLAMDEDGDFVVTWHSNASGNDGIYARRYSAAGVPQDGELLVNTDRTHNTVFPSVAADADGAFTVAWRSDGQDGDAGGIYGRHYDATLRGNPDASQTYVGDVNVATGNVAKDVTDLSLPGVGLPLAFARHYDSQNDSDWGMGRGWTFSYGDRLSFSGRSLIWADSSGRRYRFTWEGSAFGPYGFRSYVAPDALRGATLTQVATGPAPWEFGYNLRDKTGLVRHFDRTLRLARITDRNGNSHTIEYGPDGRIASVTDARDTTRRVTFGYDVTGHITSVTDFTNRTWSYAYTTQTYGDNVTRTLLASVTSPSDPQTPAAVTRYEYQPLDALGARGLLTAVTDADGGRTVYTYEPDAVHVTDAAGNVARASFNPGQRSSSFISPRGDKTDYTVDRDGHVIRTLYPDQAVDTFEWRDGRLRRKTDPFGKVEAYEYDGNGNVTRFTDRLGNVTAYTYEATFNNVISTTDANGKTTTFAYDERGNSIRITDPLNNATSMTYDGRGLLLARTTPRGNATSYTYNTAGQVLTEATALPTTVTHVYDGRGNLTGTTDAAGRTATFTYDLLGRVLTATDALLNVTRQSYDGTGDVLTSTDALGRVTRYTYDRASRLVQTTLPDESTTLTTYDANGNVSSRTDGLGRVTAFAYDSRDRQVQMTRPDGRSERSEYDADGRLIATVDALGRRTTYQYDDQGRQVSTVDPLGQRATWTHDGAGNVLTVTDVLGRVTRYAYDALNRVTAVTDAAGAVTATAYDPDGNVAGRTDPLGRATRYTYDVLGRATTATDPLGRVTRTGYDAVGNVLSATDPAGRTTSFRYDALNRRTQVIDALGGVTRSGYDAVGNVLSVTDALGRVTAHTYDALNRRLTTTDALGNVTTTAYDAAGNMIRVTDALGRVTTYGYDLLNRPTRVTDPLNRTTFTAYDAVGNVTARMDRLRRTTLYRYDALDRRVLVLEPSRVGWTRYAYDAAGNLAAVTNAKGQRTGYAYDPAGRVIAVTDATGGVTRTTYDLAGNRTTETDALGRVTRYAYDALNRVTAVTDAAGKVTTTTYDASGNVLQVTDPLGNATAYGYDDLNRRVRTTDPTNAVSTTTYDAVGNVLSVTDPRGGVTRYAYDAVNRVTAVTDALGNIGTTAYDKVGNVVSVTDVLGRTTSHEYDRLNRRTRSTDPLRNVTAWAYDAEGNVTSHTDALGRVTRYAYDARNRPTTAIDALGNRTVTTYDRAGNVASVSDRLGRVTRYAYDPLNRRTAVTDALGNTTRNSYDRVGNVLSVTDPLGQTVSYRYDDLDRRTAVTDPLGSVTRTAYDDAGNITAVTDPLGRTTTYAYDRANRPTVVTDASGGRTVTAYDANGNVTRSTAPLGQVTTYTYDTLNRRLTTTDPLGHVSTAAYDAAGNLLSSTNPLGHATRFTYDALNRRTSATDPEGGATVTAFDAVGNVTRFTDPVGNATEYAYDALNRVTLDTNAQNASRTYAYDAEGNVLSLRDRNGRVRNFSYDAVDRVTQERWLDAAAGTVRTITYDYDGNGRVVRATDPDSTYVYAYDAAGRLLSVDNGGTAGVPRVVVAYSYDAAGNRLTVSDSTAGVAGPTATYAYDALNRVARITRAGGGAAALRVDLAYDANGRLTQLRRHGEVAGTTTPVSSGFTYDDAGRLITLVHAYGASTLASYEWAYDGAGRVTDAISSDDSATYAYDRTNQLEYAGHTAHANESYGYDANGNRTGAGYATGPNNRLLSDGTYRYEYDGEGNRTTRTEIATGRVDHYAWDHRNRLTSVVTRSAAGTVVAESRYAYDVNDRRVSKSTDPDGAAGQAAVVAARYVYDGGEIALQFDGAGNRTHRYLHGPGVDFHLADDADGAAVTWTLGDNQGTVRDLASTTGVPLNHLRYDSFGRFLGASNVGGPATIFGYTGREYDAETGLNYYRARYYDASAGRFISEDPSGFKAGDSNLSRYVGNSPVNATDPSGMVWKWLKNLGNGIASGARAIGSAAKAVGGAIVSGAKAVGSGVVKSAKTVGGAVRSAASWVADKAEKVGSAIVEGYRHVGKAIASGAKWAWEHKGMILQIAADAVLNYVTAGAYGMVKMAYGLVRAAASGGKAFGAMLLNAGLSYLTGGVASAVGGAVTSAIGKVGGTIAAKVVETGVQIARDPSHAAEAIFGTVVGYGVTEAVGAASASFRSGKSSGPAGGKLDRPSDSPVIDFSDEPIVIQADGAEALDFSDEPMLITSSDPQVLDFSDDPMVITASGAGRTAVPSPRRSGWIPAVQDYTNDPLIIESTLPATAPASRGVDPQWGWVEETNARLAPMKRVFDWADAHVDEFSKAIERYAPPILSGAAGAARGLQQGFEGNYDPPKLGLNPKSWAPGVGYRVAWPAGRFFAPPKPTGR